MARRAWHRRIQAAALASTRFAQCAAPARSREGIAIGVLEVVGKAEFCLTVDAALIAPSRDPCPAGAAAAIADMKSLLDHAPIWFGAGREAQLGPSARISAGCLR
jgi:hypothetical protein